jgi:hemoglobin/transferrin/lactoferrin receptor protein
VVAANKWEQDPSEIPNELLAISTKTIEFQNPQTSADVLAASGQVFVQKSQMGGGSPMLRGFAANSVLIVVDGVRMNNAIFRSGNLQNVISIDPNALEGAEVVFGPGSVMYGSDALGGVMDFHTLRPTLHTDDGPAVRGMAMTRYSTANNEKMGHVQAHLSHKKWGTFHSLSVSSFDDLRAGANHPSPYPDFGKKFDYVVRIDDQDIIRTNPNPAVQKFSGYDQLSSVQKFLFRPSDALEITYGWYFSNTTTIPRYDRLIEYQTNGDPVFAEWYYGPQRWNMHSLKARFVNHNSLYDQGKITLAYQNAQESRIDRRLNNLNRRTQEEEVKVLTLNADFDKELARGNVFYGVEFQHNDVASDAFRENISTGVISPTTPRYPGRGSTLSGGALYINWKHHLAPGWVLNAGARYSGFRLIAQVNPEDIDFFGVDKFLLENAAINGSLGIVRKTKGGWKLNAHVSSGFRAPNVDDVGKVFDVSDEVVVVPNPGLKPQYSYNSELGASGKLHRKLQVSAVGFFTWVDQAMVRSDFLFNGQDSIEFEGTMRKVTALVNTGKAIIYGASFQAIWEAHPLLTLRGSTTYTNGRDLTADEPLRHTTPVFGQVSATLRKGPWQAEAWVEYNGARWRADIPPNEIDDKPFLYTPDGSPGWHTWNLRGAYQWNEYLQINLALENLFDLHYRPYASGISAPGRNFIVSVRGRF